MTLCMAETSRSKLVKEARCARVLERWRAGRSTHEIAETLNLAEREVCRIIEEAGL
ncbi:hypothetical protein [Agrobacterium tumefaciens]|nr:hypothetical protein [Agrobacterium tumefaciens]NSL23476.1 hypothetical protein [Agrobacterium tumefaciens]NTC64010.1 hypothetical protein [Agrobacterium tumefaciens]NTC64699.1 hypothetical protein [Agrobacterium tumefaciens]NTC91394.1 hypothetical protein [Agrobacterium tumefaciens]NTD06982.1 hypothetical protein [Agrobacterium tumefaciens]